MSGLNEHHKRRILSTFQHIDRLIEESLTELRPDSRLLFPRLVQDLSSAQLHWIESYAQKIREQMGALIGRFEMEFEDQTTPASWMLRTNLVYLDIALEDLDPERMRGYGEMDQDAARDFAWTLNEIRRLVDQLSAYLLESREIRAPGARRAGDADAAGALLDGIAEISARHGMVEFLPALQSVTQKLASHRLEIAVFGRVGSGKSSLINRLLETNVLPVGTTPMTAVPIRILAGEAPSLRVSFAHGVETLPIEQLTEFASEQGNPANTRRVTAIEIEVPATRLQAGTAFVDTPGIASLATIGAQLAYAYLPECDLGLVLIDGHGSIGREDLDLLRALHETGIPSIVLVSKCDLLLPSDIDKVVAYTRDAIQAHLGLSLEVVATSSVDSWASEVDTWFKRDIEPLLLDSRASVSASVGRKVESLRRSLLAALERRAGRGAGARGRVRGVEETLRPLDDELEELKRKWRGEVDDLSPWMRDIMEEAAARLAKADEAAASADGSPANPLAEAVLRTVASRCHDFVREYEALKDGIRRSLETLGGDGSGGLALDSYELPKAPALPLPIVDGLGGVKVAPPGFFARVSPASRVRHFRRELEKRAGNQLKQLLQEFQPRIRHWLTTTLKDLEGSYHLQTNPFRYADPAGGLEPALAAIQDDINFLRGLAAP